MKRKNLNLVALAIMLSISSNSLNAFAHPGRTDSNGGHRDNNNVSGLGSYHYHHGMEAHLHPNGICPYGNSSNSSSSSSSSSNASSSSSSSSSNESQAYKNQLEKDNGYNQGYSDAMSEKENNPSSSNSYYTEGYSSGYSKGVQDLNSEKDSVKQAAKNAGYNDGYAGKDNNSSSYSGKHKAIYTTQYNSSYNEGLEKRNKEIETITAKAKSLGLDDGYNRINRDNFDCDKNYLDIFIKSYNTSYYEGLKNLNKDILKFSNEAYITAFKNNELNLNSYNNKYIKEAVKESYEEAKNIFNIFLKDIPMLGESLDTFSTYAEGNDKIQIGTDNIDNNIFISISDKSKRKVNDINLFINSINENGYTEDVTDSLIEGLLKKEFIESYTVKSSYKRFNDQYNYNIYNLKRTNKISKSAPRKFTIITISKDDMIHEVKILKKEPKEIKQYEKI